MGLWSSIQRILGNGSEPVSANAKTKTLQISDYITDKSIVFFSSAPSKQQVLGQLISRMELPDPNFALQNILSREESGSTVVAPGLALPHARVPGLSKLQAAIGISSEGVIDPQSESGPVHIYVLFIGPTENMKEHLAFLARVSVLFQKEGFPAKLIRTGSSSKALEMIRKTEASL